jgi:hypothetical protein
VERFEIDCNHVKKMLKQSRFNFSSVSRILNLIYLLVFITASEIGAEKPLIKQT